MGATEEQLEALEQGRLEPFEPSWAAAIHWAAAMTPTAARPDDATFARLAEYWDGPAIVEITAVAALFNYFNRFAESLEIPPTR